MSLILATLYGMPNHHSSSWKPRKWHNVDRSCTEIAGQYISNMIKHLNMIYFAFAACHPHWGSTEKYEIWINLFSETIIATFFKELTWSKAAHLTVLSVNTTSAVA